MEIKDQWASAYCLAGLGGLAATQGQRAFAARLLSAAEARFAPGGSLYLPDRIEFDRDVDVVRVQRSEAAFAAAWADG
ncbi:MAG: hypothetical protein ACYDBJ_16155 [Aggregatilineales bacterium]